MANMLETLTGAARQSRPAQALPVSPDSTAGLLKLRQQWQDYAESMMAQGQQPMPFTAWAQTLRNAQQPY